MERLYAWRQISHLDVRDAQACGDLRACCAGPLCGRVAAIGRGAFPALVPLWILAARMRCKSCGHKGAMFEVWGSSSAAKFADRHIPVQRDASDPGRGGN